MTHISETFPTAEDVARHGGFLKRVACRLVRDDHEGRLVPPNDPNVLRLAIAEYLGDADLRLRHGQAARKRAEEEFSIEAMVRNYDSLYRDNFLR